MVLGPGLKLFRNTNQRYANKLVNQQIKRIGKWLTSTVRVENDVARRIRDKLTRSRENLFDACKQQWH